MIVWGGNLLTIFSEVDMVISHFFARRFGAKTKFNGTEEIQPEQCQKAQTSKLY